MMKKFLLLPLIILFYTIAGFAQAPNISYSSPQTYTLGTAIIPLTPTNNGGSIPAKIYGQVTTLVGSGSASSTNGTGIAASFNSPKGVATDSQGNVYVADNGNNLIRKITPAGVATTFAGSGAQGSANGTGTTASFSSPSGVAIDSQGNIYVADARNNLIRKITTAGVVSTFAGSGAPFGSNNGIGTAASFSSPVGVATDAQDNIYVADQNNSLIRKISPTGVVSTLAGSGFPGSANGTGTAATLLKS